MIIDHSRPRNRDWTGNLRCGWFWELWVRWRTRTPNDMDRGQRPGSCLPFCHQQGNPMNMSMPHVVFTSPLDSCCTQDCGFQSPRNKWYVAIFCWYFLGLAEIIRNQSRHAPDDVKNVTNVGCRGTPRLICCSFFSPTFRKREGGAVTQPQSCDLVSNPSSSR